VADPEKRTNRQIPGTAGIVGAVQLKKSIWAFFGKAVAGHFSLERVFAHTDAAAYTGFFPDPPVYIGSKFLRRA